MEFKDVLKNLRKARGLSQIELAAKLGVSPALIGMYETGQRKPSFEMEEAIGDFFNVSTDYLRGRESGSEYYLDPHVAQLAEEMSSKPGLRVLFDASRDLSEESLKMFAQMIDTFKKTNPEG